MFFSNKIQLCALCVLLSCSSIQASLSSLLKKGTILTVTFGPLYLCKLYKDHVEKPVAQIKKEKISDQNLEEAMKELEQVQKKAEKKQEKEKKRSERWNCFLRLLKGCG